MSEASGERTLQVRVGEREQTRHEAREAIQALEQGEETDGLRVLNLASDASLARLCRETTLELLRAISQHDPESIRATAQLVERDYKEVHRNLDELETLGVVRFEDVGASKRPVVKFDALEISVSLTE